jgi:F-type H+-transporting ATPase subunit b
MIASILLAAAEEGGHGGFEAPTWWRGEWYEVILGSIASIIIFGALFKFAGPMVKKAMAERTARIQADLDRAAATKAQAETEAAGIRSNLANADTEAATIVADARQVAEHLKFEQSARLDAEVVELRAKAIADIEVLKARSLSEVHGSVATLAIGAAEKVVEANLDHATQVALIDRFIEQVGAMDVR